MNEKATLTFVPWLRRGVSTEINQTQSSGYIGTHATFQIKQKYKNKPTPVSVPISLRGPGEVGSIDPNIIIRRYPVPNSFSVESNFFPLIEFDQPDFPWRYTPAKPEENHRLTPWISLVTLKDEEIISENRNQGNDSLPTITVSATALPNIAQQWAWAHTQIAGEIDESIAEIEQKERHRTLSRLLSPRILIKDISYRVFLVPTFERGRLAGIRDKRRLEESPVSALQPAWISESEAIVTLPIYDEWRFQSGLEGDFESLTKQLLPPVILSSKVGVRMMDVSEPGGNFPSISENPMALQGALISKAAKIKLLEYPVDVEEEFISQLNSVILEQPEVVDNNNSESVTRLIVAPPLYGKWHARRKSLKEQSTNNQWFDELNSDPRWRTAAGLGTLVVQENQRSLMAGAWKQVDGINEVNRYIALSQFSDVLSDRIHNKHIAKLYSDQFLQLTSSMPILISENQQNIVPLPGPSRKISPKILLEEVYGISGFMSEQLRRVERPFLKNSNLRINPTVETNINELEDDIKTRFVTKYAQIIDSQNKNKEAILELNRTIQNHISPANFLRASLNRRVKLPEGAFEIKNDQPIQTVLKYPEFLQPMYQSLQKLSTEWVLPGATEVPFNSVSLLETNREFIESFMVGLNHEMSRELLWREFPTDQRGSYFRQFWDHKGVYKKVGNEFSLIPAEKSHDVQEIHKWDKHLGENHVDFEQNGNTETEKENVVLIIRGELLRRYPNAIIYAKKIGEDGKLADDEKYPVFSAFLPPDLSILGFDVDTTTLTKGKGYYFFLQEQPSKPRFGLDILTKEAVTLNKNWNNLNCKHLGVCDGYIDLIEDSPSQMPDSSPYIWSVGGESELRDSTAADFAGIFYQKPFRVGLKADTMLPRD